MKKIAYLLMPLVLLLIVVSCEQKNNEKKSPKTVAEMIYEAINKNDFRQAFSYYGLDIDSDADRDMCDFMIEMVKNQFESKGGIDSFKVLEESISKDGMKAKCKTFIKYKDGSEEIVKDNFRLNEDGYWMAMLASF